MNEPTAWEKTLSPWERIVRAGKRGTGLTLSPDEAWALSVDDAIHSRAEQDTEERKEKESKS
jgi:hypothetical protein